MAKLDVTCGSSPVGTRWTGYIVENGAAYPYVGYNNLDRMREWATREGFEGIIIGSPSVVWAE
jgi:hypothetical protein